MQAPPHPDGHPLSNQQWEAFFTLSSDYLGVVGFDGHIERLNPAWEKNLGYSQGNLMSRPLLDFVHPDDRTVTQNELQNLIHGQGASSFENRLIGEDGATHWLLWSASAHPEQEIIHIVGRDITDRKQVEFALAYNTQIVEAARALQSQYITSAKPDTLFENALQTLLRFTSSEYGLIGEIDHEETSAPRLKIRALSKALLTKNHPTLNEDSATMALRAYQLDDVMRLLATTGQATINNAAERAPAANLPPLAASLGIPLHFGQELIGMAWVANRPGGYQHTLFNQISPLLNTCANLIRALRDDRRRQDAEENLRRKEIHLRTILDTVADGIITIDNQGIIETFNSAAERIFDYSTKEVLGQNVNMLMPEPYHSAHDSYIDNYKRTHKAKIIGIGREVEGRRKDGSTFPLDLTISEMIIGGEFKFAGVVRDISERQRAARQLLETTSLQNAILDSANYSIISTNPGGIIRTFNHTAEQWLGYSEDELAGKETPAIIHDLDEVIERAQTLSKELGRDIAPGFEVFVAKARLGVVDEREWTYVRKDGSRFPVMLSITALWDDHGHITGFLGVGRDITERKKIDRMKNEFISTVSHELRTPLTSIRGSLGLIAAGIGGQLSEQTKTLVDIACNNSDRLVRLINDILDIEKIESGKMRFKLENHALVPLLEQAVKANESYAAQYGARIELHHSGHDYWVRVDSDRLAQVVTNLISNAVKYSPPGGTVEVTLEHVKQGARVTVQDHGSGIPEEFRDRIFQKFAQADSSDTRQKSGTGLGLSISKAIVESMNGEIGFDSTPGEGSRFFFYLPARPRDGDKPPARDNADLETAGRPRILICEDEPDVATLLHLILEQAGFTAVIAYTAERAKQLLAEQNFEAMTLDLMLPGQDGISLIRELRANDATRDLPIIVVSAKADAGEKSLNGGAVGVIDWLNKPIDQNRLIHAVKMAHENHAPHKPNILHVEDDVDLQNIVMTILAGTAKVFAAGSLKQAEQLLAEHTFDLAILDMQLPDGSGMELLPTLHRETPSTRIIIFSASDVDRDTAGTVASTLIKSRTSNSELLNTIQSLVSNRGGHKSRQQ